MGLMSEEGADIQVALTTSKYILDSSIPEILDQAVEENLPICVSEFNLSAAGMDIRGEKAELDAANLLMKMMQNVYISSPGKTVRIGIRPDVAETLAVDYYQEKDTVPSVEFFKRWDETHYLIFEFQVFYKDNDPAFTIRGIFKGGTWTHKSMDFRGNISIVGTLQ